MFTTCEKDIINKGYDEYDGKNIWNFYKTSDEKAQITLGINPVNNHYIFSFPLINSKWNYRITFEKYEEAQNYIRYVVDNYL